MLMNVAPSDPLKAHFQLITLPGATKATLLPGHWRWQALYIETPPSRVAALAGAAAANIGTAAITKLASINLSFFIQPPSYEPSLLLVNIIKLVFIV